MKYNLIQYWNDNINEEENNNINKYNEIREIQWYVTI